MQFQSKSELFTYYLFLNRHKLIRYILYNFNCITKYHYYIMSK